MYVWNVECGCWCERHKRLQLFYYYNNIENCYSKCHICIHLHKEWGKKTVETRKKTEISRFKWMMWQTKTSTCLKTYISTSNHEPRMCILKLVTIWWERDSSHWFFLQLFASRLSLALHHCHVHVICTFRLLFGPIMPVMTWAERQTRRRG